MGPRYVVFRMVHTALRRSGVLRLFYPTAPRRRECLSLAEWREQARPFFWSNRAGIRAPQLEQREARELESHVNRILRGHIQFFNGRWVKLGPDYDWLTNPETGYRYSPVQHWTAIPDFDERDGDIKYVWEKSRFCFLYPLMRFDHHTGSHSGDFVFKEIASWIRHSRLNCGPNYVCSQEISLRVLNWVFALYFYRDSSALTPEIFDTIMHSLYWQTRHVESNFSYSLIAVRNNHAITESLCLYTLGTLFPWLPRARQWRNKGKRFLVREGLYQIYADGSYLQHSMNYHRVVVQLYTWALRIGGVNGDAFPEALRQRLNTCVTFLRGHQDTHTGMLPHYGNNDGSLFFPLNSCHFRDYRPQINALHWVLHGRSLWPDGNCAEDICWFGGEPPTDGTHDSIRPLAGVSEFSAGGYYVLRADDRFCIIRCARHRHRPFHNDNLHCDVWDKGLNLIRDTGTYGYNTTAERRNAFEGTAAHNTVGAGEYDQMQRLGRFSWSAWSQALSAHVAESVQGMTFQGAVRAFTHSGSSVVHHRQVEMMRSQRTWVITDRLDNWNGAMHQFWNLHPDYQRAGLSVSARDGHGRGLVPDVREGLFAPTYGEAETCPRLVFTTSTDTIVTTLTVN